MRGTGKRNAMMALRKPTLQIDECCTACPARVVRMPRTAPHPETDFTHTLHCVNARFWKSSAEHSKAPSSLCPHTCACRCTAALLYAATPVPVLSTTADWVDPRWLWRSMSISGTSFAPGALASRSTKHLHASKGAAPSPILLHHALRHKAPNGTRTL